MIADDALQSEVEQAIKSEHLTTLGASWLQKRFRIDYQTAVHLIDRLEESQIIGPAGDDRFRHVLNQGGYSIFD